MTAERARILTAILLRHPDLLHDLDHAYAELPLPAPLDRLRAALTRLAAEQDALDSASVMTHLQYSVLAADAAETLSAVPLPLPACAAEGAMPAEAEIGWWHFFGLVRGAKRLEAEVAVTERDLAEHGTERAQSRHIALCTALNHLRRGEQGADD